MGRWRPCFPWTNLFLTFGIFFCAAAVSAKITAMDAVAQNLGVDSQELADKPKVRTLPLKKSSARPWLIGY